MATNYTTHYLSGNFIVRLPKTLFGKPILVTVTLVTPAPGLPKTFIYWNAALTFLMFKEDKGPK
jgi:hypothetical protein